MWLGLTNQSYYHNNFVLIFSLSNLLTFFRTQYFSINFTTCADNPKQLEYKAHAEQKIDAYHNMDVGVVCIIRLVLGPHMYVWSLQV